MNAALCRRLLGPDKILGVSAQTPEQAIQAEKDGADYLGTGAVYPTMYAWEWEMSCRSKDDADAVGVEGLRRVCESVDIPVVSIGGVNAQNAGETIEAGAGKSGNTSWEIVGIAVISAIFNRPDIREAAHELRTAVDKALSKWIWTIPINCVHHSSLYLLQQSYIAINYFPFVPIELFDWIYMLFSPSLPTSNPT